MDEGADVEEGMKEKKMARKKMVDKPTNSNAGDGNVNGAKKGNAMCTRCGKIGHITVRCPE